MFRGVCGLLNVYILELELASSRTYMLSFSIDWCILPSMWLSIHGCGLQRKWANPEARALLSVNGGTRVGTGL